MAGRVIRDGEDVCFVPRFAFLDGTTYLVTGATQAVLVRPQPVRPVRTEVLEIRPTASDVPRNLLRFYVRFSAPMSEGYAAGHVRLLEETGDPMVGALLPTEYELWDADRLRLTVLLDPARIKRGLLAHRQAGYPLRRGASFSLVVDGGFRDARGIPLRAGAERSYQVGPDERRRVEPDRWSLVVPWRGTSEPLEVWFDRPLDHGLLGRCLGVLDPDGRPVDGTTEIGSEERSWRLTPGQRWTPGPHQLVVDPILEDIAGNSVSRVFDRDLRGDDPGPAQPVRVSFRPR
jgi:hypothetical protein